MSDNAQRLRRMNDALLITGQDYSDTLLDAAAEIELLRKEIANLVVAASNDATAFKTEIELLRGLLREGMEDQISEIASRYVGWPDNEYTKRKILRDSEWAIRVREALGDKP